MFKFFNLNLGNYFGEFNTKEGPTSIKEDPFSIQTA
jgi:hypothetical protein